MVLSTVQDGRVWTEFIRLGAGTNCGRCVNTMMNIRIA